jgi:DNA polymerase IV
MGMRKIIHIDMDAFYASVEIRNQPDLQNKPVAIGSSPEQRGVLSTCNYIARQYGCHSAMSSSKALRLCPQLVLLPVNMPLYKQESRKIHRIFQRYTNLIEPLSLDEAYLDVTQSTRCNGNAQQIAQEIREQIHQELQLTASAGIAHNKMLAKIASDWNKPNGQFYIPEPNTLDFMKVLSLQKIPGVGKVAFSKLQALGYNCCGDLWDIPLYILQKHFGKLGSQLFARCRGEDHTPVQPHRERKSLSVEDTFVTDLTNLQQCLDQMANIYQEFLKRLHALKARGQFPHITPPYVLFIKIKYSSFTSTTMERRFEDMSRQNFMSLLTQRYTENPAPVRLLGLGIHLPEPAALNQEHGEHGDQGIQLSFNL